MSFLRTTWRSNVTRRVRVVRGEKIETFDAYVRGPELAREYVGSGFGTREEAVEACEAYLRTGAKPAARKRGPKGGRRKQGPRMHVVKASPAPRPAAPSRLDMLRKIFKERLAA